MSDWWHADPLVSQGTPDPAKDWWHADPVISMDQAHALWEGAKSGATAGFSDELTGAAAASGVPKSLQGGPKMPGISPLVSALYGGARLAYDALYGKGKGETTKTYEKVRDEARAEQKVAQEQFPKTYISGEVGGALLLPGGIESGAATLPIRAARAAATGAGIGALTGFGEGEGASDSTMRALEGGAIGGAVGGVAAPLIEAEVQGAQYAAPRITGMVRSAVAPRTEAERQIVTAIERDIDADPTAEARLTPQEFVQARREGQPVAVMDMGGGLTRRLADVANIASPEGGAVLNRAINQRFESQAPRLAEWLRQTFHYPDAAAQQEAIDNVARTVNRSAYARAHRDPRAQAMWDGGFEQLMQAPVVQEAARKATATGANRSAMQGFTPVRRPFEFHDTQSLTPRYTQRTDPEGRRILPNLEFWDHVKRNLDDKINSLQRAGENSAARDASSFARL